MAVKKTQMYRKNLDTSETNLYPLTEAQYVSMENGQTVQEILSDRDSDKYTPVITNSSSTFKVGQGDNVDLSSSMKEGAYDSCVLKGKTMVNCIQEPSSKDVVLPYEFADGRYVTINDTKESGALGVELKGQTLVNIHKLTTPSLAAHATGWYENLVRNSGEIRFDVLTSPEGWRYINAGYLNYQMLKPNTKYLVVFESSQNISSIHFMRGDGLNGLAPSTVPVQNSKAIITTNSQIVANEQILYVNFRAEPNTKVSFKNPMIIEYVEGMENWDIPYIEGMTSCKMPILKSVNQMFDYSLATTPMGSANTSFSNDGRNLKVSFETNRNCNQNNVGTLPIGTYEVSYEIRGYVEGESVLDSRAGIVFPNSSEAWWSTGASVTERFDNMSVGEYAKVTRTIVVSEPVTITMVYHAWGDNAIGWCEFRNIRIVPQGKSSILSLPEEVILRSLPNGVCDTFNTRTGVYTQRIKEVVFDGSNDESWNIFTGDWVLENSTVFCTYISGVKGYAWSKYTGKEAISDKIPSYPDNWLRLNDVLGMTNDNTGARKQFRIPKSYLETDNVNGFRKWLEQNPVTACFELATPIITKVNLSSTLKSWNTTTHIYSEIPENTLYPILSHSNPSYPVILKPSTKYSIVANSYSNGHTNSPINFNLGGATASTTVGNRVTTITTPSTLSNELLTMSGRGNKLNNVMVIEGDVVGDESYFEGICDCKSPILSNTGKNLINALNCSARMGAIILSKEQNCITFKTPNAWGGLVYHLYLKPNTTYTFSFEGDSVDTRGYVRYKTGMSDWSGGYGGSNKYTFTTDGLGVVMFTIESATVRDSVTVKNIMIEEATTKNLYEPHKSNTTTFDQKDGKTIVLRSLPSGACDTLNVETGEYVQRIGEYTYNGDNDVKQHYVSNNNHGQSFFTIEVSSLGRKEAIAGISDTLPHESIYSAVEQTKNAFCVSLGGNTAIRFYIDKLTTTEQYRNHFRNAPITIQYELATPIVTTIDVQGFPYAYTNGHVQLSSGSIEQSLTPKVEYSLSANKTGQINSNTKRASAHQKQLDDFEAMMLTQMVQSVYDKAILQFDYEMQMMSLGGE